MAKGKGKVDGLGTSRERTISWDDDRTKFMLEWCIKFMKKQHAGYKFKKTHHIKCVNALNQKFAMGVTLAQVDRHFRHYKENRKIVAVALSKSGNAFDHTRCLVTISESEKASLNDRTRRLLSKPIKFFNEMQELFTGSGVDGSLAMDQQTCMDSCDDSDSDGSEGLLDLNGYTQPEDTLGEDSGTLPTPPHLASKKRQRGSKSPTKKPKKTKSRFAETTEEISTIMRSLQQMFAATAPQMPQLDPHAILWQRLEAIPLIPDQRLTVSEHLSSKGNKGTRDWLCNPSEDTLHT